jgi:hypothetical protein
MFLRRQLKLKLSPLMRQQIIFTFKVARLILWAYLKGYGLTFGDAARMDGKGHKKNSFHYIRLAIDLNLIKNGKYMKSTEDYLPLGRYWERIGGTWGGHWGDGNHFSWGE